MADYSYQWSAGNSDFRRVAAANEDHIAALSAQISALTSQVASINAQDQFSREGEGEVMEDCQFFNNRAFNSYQATDLPIHHHKELWNQDQFPYASNQNSLSPPEIYSQQPPGYISSPGFQNKPTLEDTLADFISESRARFAKNEARVDRVEERLDKIESNISELVSILNSLSEQIGNLAYAVKGKNKVVYTPDQEEFPSDCKAAHCKSGWRPKEPSIDPQRDEEVYKSFIVVPTVIRGAYDPPDVTPKQRFPQKAEKKKIGIEDATFEEVCSWMELLNQDDRWTNEGLGTDSEQSEASESVEKGRAERTEKEANQSLVEHKGGQEKSQKVHHSVSPPRKRKSKGYGPVTIHKILPSGAIELINKERRIYRAKRHRFNKKEEDDQGTNNAKNGKSLQSDEHSRKSS